MRNSQGPGDELGMDRVKVRWETMEGWGAGGGNQSRWRQKDGEKESTEICGR